MALHPQLVSGARGVIQAQRDDGILIPIAFATDITVNVRHGVRPTFVMGEMNAAAIDSLAYDVDVSVGRVLPVNASDATPNFNAAPTLPPRTTPNSASALGLGLEAATGGSDFNNTLLFTGELTIQLQDRVTGQYIASVRACRFSGRSLNVNSGDIGTERLNYIGIYDAVNGQPGQAPEMGYGLGT